MVRGSPCMCIATQPAPVAAATSQSVAEMSLSRLAPAATAAHATSSLTVSTEIRAPRPAASAGQSLDHGHHAGQLLVGGHRRRSGARRLTADVDDVGPLARSACPCAMAASVVA